VIHLFLCACAAREIPPHLRVDDGSGASAPTAVGTSLEDLVGHDPLVRRPPPAESGHWRTHGDAVEAWAAIARRENVDPTDWDALEARFPSTLAVPLARGARLAVLEVKATEDLTPSSEASIARWLGHVQADEATATAPPGPPLAWLGSKEPLAAALHIAERNVLLGWLDGPEIPVGAAAAAMQPGIHDRLLDEPAGHLLAKRAQGASDPDARVRGAAALARATLLALNSAAADRDSDQRKAAEELAKARVELGGEPVPLLLAKARTELSMDATEDVAAGLALVALSAERVLDACPDRPCGGLDRTATLARSEAWGPEVAPWARTWRLVALKQGVDTFEVSHDRPTFYQVIPDLADALVGTGAGIVPLVLLQQRAANPVALLALSRAAAGVDSTDLEGTSLALRKRLVATADLVLEHAPTPEIGALAQRIRDGASRPPDLR
jgi:hypothetical protein